MSLRSFLWIIVLLGLMLLSVGQFIKQSSRAKANNAIVQDVSITQQVTPSPRPTDTPIPSATIDYQQTAAIAQSTADEARRNNALATTEWLSLVNEQLRMTAEIERQEFEIIMLTATAASTAIPMTQTQQAIANSQTAKQQAILSGQMTATHEAPTQAYAIIAAENARRYGASEHVVKIIAMWSIVIFLVILCTWLYYRWNQEERQLQLLEAKEPEPEQKEPIFGTVVTRQTDKGNGDFEMQRFVIPCTPEQLSEFAEAITQGKKTMAINQWEGANTLFTRPIILQLRAWARANDFAAATDDNQLAPTNDFLDFLCRWLDKQALPSEYEFIEKEPESPSPSAVLA